MQDQENVTTGGPTGTGTAPQMPAAASQARPTEPRRKHKFQLNKVPDALDLDVQVYPTQNRMAEVALRARFGEAEETLYKYELLGLGVGPFTVTFGLTGGKFLFQLGGMAALMG